MTCYRIKNLLSEYVDDYLDLDTKQKVENHLSKCDKCNTVYHELLTLNKLLCSIKPVEATEADIKESLEEIYQAINTGSESTGKIINFPNSYRRKKSFKFTAVAASAVLAVTVYFSIQHYRQKPVVNKDQAKNTAKQQEEIIIAKPKPPVTQRKNMEMAFWVNYEIKDPSFAHAGANSNANINRVIQGIGNVSLHHSEDGSGQTEIYDSLDYLNDLNKEIQSKIKNHQGSILFVDLQSKTPYIEAEIPVDNFESFSTFMDKIGDTQKIIPHNINNGVLSAIDQDKDQFIQVRITIDVPN